MRTSTKQQPLLMRAATTLLLAVLVLAAVPQRAGAQTPATIGGIVYNSVGGYYEIDEPDDLRDLATYVNGTGKYRDNTTETTAHNCSGLKFKMTQDITFTHDTDWNYATSDENNFVAIGGYYGSANRDFEGDFDGAGHTISGIRIHRSGNTDADRYQGIFGRTWGANIHGLRLADTRITGYDRTGGIVGHNIGTVTDCHVASDVCIHAVQSYAYYHGGIAGYNVDAVDGSVDGAVANCTSAATLTVPPSSNCKHYGAIAGYNNDGTLRDNLAIGATVPAAADNNTHGAIAGYNDGGTLQRNYYTACKVAGVENATNVGCQNADVAADDGAVSVLTLNGNTYTISNTGGWNAFCYLLAENEKGYFDGKTIKLANNITVTWMAGGSHHDFTGTFDGQGHTLTVSYGSASAPVSDNNAAPFRNVESGCKIEKLHVAGDIYTTAKYAAGIAGTQYGVVTIRNCHVSTVIHSLTAGDGTHGGIVGNNGNGTGSALSIEGCLFDGKLLTEGETATTNCSGFVGYRSNNRTVTITNSLYAPAALADGETEVEDGTGTISATFVRNGAAGSNCYYTRTLGTAQGKQALTHEAVSAVGEPIATYNVSGISIYGNGMQYGSTFYYDPERNFLRTVKGHNNEDGGWVFIASPLAAESIAPSEVQNLIATTEEDYDLYRFNQSDPNGNEWQNWKATTEQNHPDFTELVNGQGYLYATKDTRTLVFAGEYTATTAPVEVPLAYDPDANLAGWNLVGNPFATPATMTDGNGQPISFYVISGQNVVPYEGGATTIERCTGVMVKANGTGEKVYFTSVSPDQAPQPNNGSLQIALSQVSSSLRGKSSTIDKAIVSFNEGSRLEKFVFNKELSKLYIPQGGKEYAIATAGRDGACTVSAIDNVGTNGGTNVGTDGACTVSTMPVNFKATEDGTYTITVNPDNVELAYLHLIDNMTGADVDLLAANGRDAMHCVSTYTFTAKTTDYESRFKLVFAAEGADGPSTGSGAFAYISNGEIIINDADARGASLQVVDVMGRVVVSVGGHTRCVPTTGMAAGVYVLRLVNGNDVKTQKIVVE